MNAPYSSAYHNANDESLKFPSASGARCGTIHWHRPFDRVLDDTNAPLYRTLGFAPEAKGRIGG